MIDQSVPDPLLGAGYPRAREIVSTLVDAGFEVEHYSIWSTRADRRRMRSSFAGAVVFHRGQGRRGLRRVLRKYGSTYEALFVSRPPTMESLTKVGWKPGWGGRRPPVVYDAEALFAVRERRRRALYPPEMNEAEHRAELADELRLMAAADAIATAGRGDAATIRSEIDIPTVVVPHSTIARTDAPAGFAERRDILFVGRLTGPRDQSPNVDSIHHLVAEIMPALDRLIGSDYVVRLAGMLDSPEIEALRSDRVVVLGPVDDLRELYEQSRVFVAPTRFSAGIPLKVVEAMSQGIPCVVTPQLAEQLDTDSPAVAVGDGAEGFARACARVFTDPVAWQASRDSGLAYVATACSPQLFRRQLVEVIDAAVAHAHGRTGQSR